MRNEYRKDGEKMCKKIKKTIRIVALFMAVIISICFTGIGSVGEVKAAGNILTIKASQIDEDSIVFRREDLMKDKISDVVFVLDKDIELTEIFLPSVDNEYIKTFTVKGDHTLYIKDKGRFNIYVDTLIESGVKIRLGTSGGEGAEMDITGKFTSYGDITFFNGGGLYGGEINICGGSFSAFNSACALNSLNNVSITGGKIRISNTTYPGIFCRGDGYSLNISGGDIYVESKDVPIFNYGPINITGGNIEAIVSKSCENYSSTPAIAGRPLNISNNMNITKPEDGVVIDFAFSETSTDIYKVVADPTGVIAQSTYITKVADDGNVPGGNPDKTDYKNEWINGRWYDSNGKQTYAETLSWKTDEYGWYVQDTAGWYPKSEWVKIDGKWYFFCADGYMDFSEYRDGCWLGADGAWVKEYSGGHWMSDKSGWWYEDASGWYPVSQWVWIDGFCYYFGSDGYMLTNQYVDGNWVGPDGAWTVG